MSVLFEMRGLCFGYGTVPVLKDADFILARGERVGLLGANGAGKSTLLRVMVGLLRPQAGRIVAFGQERRRERDFREVRRRAGIVFQDPDDQLFCPTVWDDVAFGPLNLGWPRSRVEKTVAQTLAHLGIAHLKDRAPHHLSGGEKRLAALATVLAMEPETLLLDEPTAGLDDTVREHLIALLAELPQAMVVVAHDHDLHARLGVRRVLLRDGRLETVPAEAAASAR